MTYQQAGFLLLYIFFDSFPVAKMVSRLLAIQAHRQDRLQRFNALLQFVQVHEREFSATEYHNT